MCYAILKVRYRNTTERDVYVEVEQSEQLQTKLDEVKNRPEVTGVTIFRRGASHNLVTEWKVDADE